MDTFGWGLLLWLAGFALGMLAFPFVEPKWIGLVVLPIMLPVTLWVAYRRFHGLGAPHAYYVVVGVVWCALAVVLDYVLLVRAFEAADYYDADIFVYYALAFLIPVVTGMVWGARPKNG